jgi:beta-mannosidase
MPMKKLDLNGSWWFRAVDAYGLLPPQWKDALELMSAEVPGTVHTDLLKNGLIQDPYYRMNEQDLQWIDLVQWEYSRTFDVDATLLHEDVVYLVACGLDTYADIRCNGKKVAITDNMFVEHRCEIRKLLRAGKNRIVVTFDSPTVRARMLERKHGPLEVALEPQRVYIRKAQYSFGWDWGPRLATSGIWRNVSLEGFSHARLKDPFVKIRRIGVREALVDVTATVERYRRSSLQAHIIVNGGDAPVSATESVRGNRLKMSFRVRNPRLWWPSGMGEQPMYHAIITLRSGTDELQWMKVQFALRTVKLIQEEDAGGKSFVISINGERVYCKGANWIPGDSFLPRMPDDHYERLLRLAKDAHMNMVRVWGGGVYERDTFYDLCDRLGLMVWQDFMYACGEYPDTKWFLRGAEEEAIAIVQRLRNHPGIVLWCGNNECEWLYCTAHRENSPDDMRGSAIFRDTLPAVVNKYDGTRPYWRSTPFGRGFPNAESNGNHHQWEVWSFWKDYPEYRKNTARFVTEFGFQAPAHLRTYEEVTLPDDRHPQSPVMEHRNKQVEGTERLFRFQAAHYTVGKSFEEFVYKGQLVQAEALKCAVEHWRRRKYRTAGSLFWQLNDCWPVSSWSVIDSCLRPKAAYYYARRFFAPVLVSFVADNGEVEVWVSSDLRSKLKGRLEMRLLSFGGEQLWSHAVRSVVPADGSTPVYRIGRNVPEKGRPDSTYLLAQFTVTNVVMARNRTFFLEPKHLVFPDPGISTTLDQEAEGAFILTLRAQSFARNVSLDINGEDILPDDNFFDLDAREIKTIRFRSMQEHEVVSRNLVLRWLR